jgi:hypothetical protein
VHRALTVVGEIVRAEEVEDVETAGEFAQSRRITSGTVRDRLHVAGADLRAASCTPSPTAERRRNAPGRGGSPAALERGGRLCDG